MRHLLLGIIVAGLAVSGASAQTSLETPPVGTMAQVMRGLYFPNSNIIFDAQMRDPGAPPEPAAEGDTVTATFSGIYTGWQVVENAALLLAEGASLIDKPGRLCENGRMAPVGRYDWLRWSREMTDVSWDIYQAALAKDQEQVSDLTNDLAQACDNCHRVYRSNAQANRLRCLGSGVVLPR
tara:strand:- start:409 stop:951 length:543 start_codon:yes stop_codon:yes gene_type:complete